MPKQISDSLSNTSSTVNWSHQVYGFIERRYYCLQKVRWISVYISCHLTGVLYICMSVYVCCDRGKNATHIIVFVNRLRGRATEKYIYYYNIISITLCRGLILALDIKALNVL